MLHNLKYYYLLPYVLVQRQSVVLYFFKLLFLRTKKIIQKTTKRQRTGPYTNKKIAPNNIHTTDKHDDSKHKTRPPQHTHHQPPHNTQTKVPVQIYLSILSIEEVKT